MAWSGNELILCLTSAQRDQRACRAGLKVDMKLIETCASRFCEVRPCFFLALICWGLGNLLALCPLVCILWLSHLSPLELSQTPHVLKAGPPPVESNCWCLLVSLFIKKMAHAFGHMDALCTYMQTSTSDIYIYRYILSYYLYLHIVIYLYTNTHTNIYTHTPHL